MTRERLAETIIGGLVVAVLTSLFLRPLETIPLPLAFAGVLVVLCTALTIWVWRARIPAVIIGGAARRRYGFRGRGSATLALAISLLLLAGLYWRERPKDQLAKERPPAIRPQETEPVAPPVKQPERQAEEALAPPPADPASIKWATRLWNGETMTARIDHQIPGGGTGPLYIMGETYTVRFLKERCEWETIGPIRHPTEGLIDRHVNRAGPHVAKNLGIHESGHQAAECHSPLKNLALIAGVPVQFDQAGVFREAGSALAFDASGQRFPPVGHFLVPSQDHAKK